MNFDSAEDRNSFIENNMKLVTSRVMKLNNGIFDDDLFQEGSLALVIAVDRFDPDKGFKFATFAVRYIVCKIIQQIREAFRKYQRKQELFDLRI